MPLAPIPIHRRRPPARLDSSDALLVEKYLFSSLLVGWGVMASLSVAGLLQHFLPGWRFEGFPLAGLIGLLSGWALTIPVARWSARSLESARLGMVLAVTVVAGLVWATPAAIYAPAIGWMGGALRMYIVAGVLSASGLVWGGYLNCDRLTEA